MGETWGIVSVIELAASRVVRLGRSDTLSDNCGVDQNHCTIRASRISVKPGKVPTFFREVFVQSGEGGAWRQAGGIASIRLQRDVTEFELLK
jgi:hypothetical protein